MKKESADYRSKPVARAKFFFRENERFHLQGVTYGPFRPRDEDGDFFASEARTEQDFQLIREAGLNTLRVYHTPPKWWMDLAAKHELYVMVTVPWKERVLFLDSRKTQREIRETVRESARVHAGHEALLGFFIDNEIPSDLVRWYGARRVEGFLDSLVEIVKAEDEKALAAYANFPPTEFLLPSRVDFYSYNVYLHDPNVLKAYLERLQNLAEDKPLVVGEFGMDTIRHPEAEQAELLESFYDVLNRTGLAGSFVFAWTDEWFTNGIEVEDWAFGLVRKDRSPKPSYAALQKSALGPGDSVAEKFPLENAPKVSVVVCSYNGGATLRACLESLRGLHYPDYEVVVVDDGSKDDTPEIVADFPEVVSIRQPNKGLSVARNVGAERASGDVIVYTDSDCMADKDWLYYLVGRLMEGPFAAVGGPNISPPARDWVQAAVAVSPGSPSHVLLSDDEAEHVPGCNMAFHRWALELIGGFDPEYRKAGDDVDVCWRLMQAGHRIGFSPAALVWHHRRFTVDAYFGQQRGYGEAEALLKFKHTAYFDSSGSARWRGTIYGQNHLVMPVGRPVIYHGVFGTGFFQSIYPQSEPMWIGLVTSLEWWGLIVGLVVLSLPFEVLRVLPLILVGLTLAAGISRMLRARLEPRFDFEVPRLLVFYLALAQPVTRAWARYFTWLKAKRTPPSVLRLREARGLPLFYGGMLSFWSEQGGDRLDLLLAMERSLEEEGWKYSTDTGWTDWDLQVYVNRWWHVRMRTLTEIYPNGRRLTRLASRLIPTSFSLLTAGAGTLAALVSLNLWPISTAWWALAGALIAMGWLLNGLLLRRRIGKLARESAITAGLKNV